MMITIVLMKMVVMVIKIVMVHLRQALTGLAST
jgi:hypothetical protein